MKYGVKGLLSGSSSKAPASFKIPYNCAIISSKSGVTREGAIETYEAHVLDHASVVVEGLSQSLDEGVHVRANALMVHVADTGLID